MALKDTWIDKVDGIDIISTEDINQVAQAVISLEVDSEEVKKEINELNKELDGIAEIADEISDIVGEPPETATIYVYWSYDYDEVAYTVTYEVGMTWEQWCNSDYNTAGLFCQDGLVWVSYENACLYRMLENEQFSYINGTDIIDKEIIPFVWSY